MARLESRFHGLHMHTLRAAAFGCAASLLAAQPATALVPSYGGTNFDTLRSIAMSTGDGLAATNIRSVMWTAEGLSRNERIGVSSCSGLALSAEIVLTAAHCFDGNFLTAITPYSGFGLYRPSYGNRSGVAQGTFDTLAATGGQASGGWDIQPSGNYLRFGQVQAVAWHAMGGNGPDLALVRVTSDHGLVASVRPLISPGAAAMTIDPAQLEQQTGRDRVYFPSMAVGFSGGDPAAPRRLTGGRMMITPGLVNFDSDWGALVGYRQDVDIANRYLLGPAGTYGSPPTPVYNTLRQGHARVVAGDSGGPLYLQTAQGLVVAGIAQSATGATEFSGPGSNSVQWLALEPYLARIADMRAALEALPMGGTSPAFPVQPTSFAASAATVINRFITSAQQGFLYADPFAGLAEEIEITSGHLLAGIDFLNLDTSQLAIQFEDAGGRWQDAHFTLDASNRASFATLYREVRVTGLGVRRGTAISLGFDFRDHSGTGDAVSFEWRNVDVMTAVPEPVTWLLMALGLGVLARVQRPRAGPITGRS